MEDEQERTERDHVERRHSHEGHTENIGATGGARPKRRTEKGKPFVAGIRWKDCTLLGNRVLRQMDKLGSLIDANTENVHIVANDLEVFRVTCEELKRAFTNLHGELESPDDLRVAEDWYDQQNRQTQDFIEKTEVWILCAKRKIEEQLDLDGGSAKSSQRSKSSRSPKSSIVS